MSLSWKQLQKLLVHFETCHGKFDPSYKHFIWGLFCALTQVHAPQTLLGHFVWLVTIFICFFGKFVQTVALKDFIESLFSFKLNLEKFNVQLELVKKFMFEAARKHTKEGTPLDITSRETHSESNQTSFCKATPPVWADST